MNLFEDGTVRYNADHAMSNYSCMYAIQTESGVYMQISLTKEIVFGSITLKYTLPKLHIANFYYGKILRIIIASQDYSIANHEKNRHFSEMVLVTEDCYSNPTSKQRHVVSPDDPDWNTLVNIIQDNFKSALKKE